jgi:hypothetical protein
MVVVMVWLHNVQGVINGTHIDILKPQGAFVKDYYYHKTRGYSIITRVVVNCNKFFINLFVGLPRSVKDSKVLCTFALYRQAQYNGLFEMAISFN